MSIDRFGTHILNKFGQNSFTGSNTLNVVNINNVKLYYNIILPFIGTWNKSKQKYDLLQDGRPNIYFRLRKVMLKSLNLLKVCR